MAQCVTKQQAVLSYMIPMRRSCTILEATAHASGGVCVGGGDSGDIVMIVSLCGLNEQDLFSFNF